MSDSIHIVCPGCQGLNRVPKERLGGDPKCGRCSDKLFSGMPLALGEAGFRRHIQRNEIPVLVDFWAPWCGPCKTMAPAFVAAASRLEPTVRLVKIDTEVHQGLAVEFGIRSIPTLALFKGGKELSRVSGAMDTGALVNWVRQNIK
ncbi:MAG: thioredoxin TrxC [Candidatus Sedimenticola sp. (ex Thyasira tokunagai)]